ncbi:coiled-coil domain-containing protein 15 [Cheilinus undulatus]|uniref:coiled-coil domain-containing protein 15 n=1 Tax=Cheilinus undulatus TaxID=241271 RepID=UPI001BD2D737|nr:coiled-coil domain-containing protein 15 [Cheilinus undulatus]
MFPMSSRRVLTSKRGKCKASVSRNKEHPATKASKVLAERNQAVVAVGAWVEEGQDFVEHPSALALLTEEIQAEKRRASEESLRRFQDEVRHRVAQQAQIIKRREQPQACSGQYQVWTQHATAGEKQMPAGGTVQQRVKGRSFHESVEGMRQVRLRLAACRMDPQREITSDLPGGEWNISPTRHRSHMLRADQDDEEREEDELEDEEEGEDCIFTSQHKCPLVQQKSSGWALLDSDKSQPHPGFQTSLRVPQVLWPLPDQEELKRQQQSQFLMHRRQYMNIERERVKENKQHRKHLKRTARIKAEKEQIRLQEERRLERDRQLEEARHRMEERELLILERLRLEEEEERAVELQRRRREEKCKTDARFIEAMRAQMKERLSQTSVDLPPLCCCASSFWDSHPDICANNCVFHNNPKEYAKVLHSTMLNLDLR